MADTPKVYVLCDQNCRYESLTREQILTAITQAVENGEITDLDTGFITTIKTINGTGLKFFVGEQHEYDTLTAEQKEGLFAIITNDTTKEGLLNTLADHENKIDANKKALDAVIGWYKGVTIGTYAVRKAQNANILNNDIYQTSQILGSASEVDLKLEYGHEYLIQVILDGSFYDDLVGNVQDSLQCLNFVLSIPPLEMLTPKHIAMGNQYYIYSSISHAYNTAFGWLDFILRINPSDLKCKLMTRTFSTENTIQFGNYAQASNAIEPTVFRVSAIKREGV